MDTNGIMSFIDELNADDVTLTKADESAILLTALQDACTPEEYQLVMENMHELELYGLIDNADIVTEAKKIVYKQTREMNLNREQQKAAIRLARAANTASYKKYEKGRKMWKEAKAEICKQFGSKAKTEAKKVISNSRKKSSAMKSSTVTGKVISDKLDKKVNEMN
jgi:vacuolar-type H+-ATPase subunit H